jgi:hypothetical protein
VTALNHRIAVPKAQGCFGNRVKIWVHGHRPRGVSC